MNTYKVEWVMDIEADTPEAAARKAFAHMQRPGTTANCFKVFDGTGDFVDIDLEDLDQTGRVDEWGTVVKQEATPEGGKPEGGKPEGGKPEGGKPDLLAYARAEPEQAKWRSEFEGHIQSARDNFADDDLEIDDTPLVAPGVDGSGIWINAWVWVESNQGEDV